MKYQFSIRFQKNTSTSAASKAVLDCSKLFLAKGYIDYSFTVWDNKHKISYYLRLLKGILTFLASIKKNSIVGVQYPLLSINNIFRYFIRAARLKNIKFFCIIHDLESLRTGGKNLLLIKKEIDNLHFFDCVIAHNDKMKMWLECNGYKNSILSLGLFDYLASPIKAEYLPSITTIVFAGNLSKSDFIYSLSAINNWQFTLYGPNFNAQRNTHQQNVAWIGEFNPDEIIDKLEGGFGLIWDGEHIDKCDEVLGNYLKYNNPHKFSLYIAAGLPVIAPKDSAIAVMIEIFDIGVLINSLNDLLNLEINELDYLRMKANINKMSEKVRNGDYFSSAIMEAEKILKND